VVAYQCGLHPNTLSIANILKMLANTSSELLHHIRRNTRNQVECGSANPEAMSSDMRIAFLGSVENGVDTTDEFRSRQHQDIVVLVTSV
jgi:hypothetical protein